MILHLLNDLMCFCYRDDSTEKRIQRAIFNEDIDAKFGFDHLQDSSERIGWLINMHPVSKSIFRCQVFICIFGHHLVMLRVVILILMFVLVF